MVDPDGWKYTKNNLQKQSLGSWREENGGRITQVMLEQVNYYWPGTREEYTQRRSNEEI